MATRTIARMFDSYSDATAAVRDLETAGFSHNDVSLVGNRADTETDDQATTETGTGAGTGATLGTIVGGGAGLLAGLGALAIPGLGPVVAAGWLIATLTGAGVGAAAGGLLGGLTGAGVSEEDANVYAEGVRRGGTLVTVRADDARAAEVEGILARHNPVDVGARGEEYRASGWSRYDETAPMGGVGTTTAGGMMGTTTRDIPATGAATGLGQRDGTPGNPPGTMASRGVDRAAGTNVSGAYPGNETRRSTMAGTSAPGGVPDDGKLIPDQPDGTPGNPPGTKLSRGVDEVAGSNISGAHPENETDTTGRRRDERATTPDKTTGPAASGLNPRPTDRR